MVTLLDAAKRKTAQVKAASQFASFGMRVGDVLPLSRAFRFFETPAPTAAKPQLS
jgi:hypothetical protein